MKTAWYARKGWLILSTLVFLAACSGGGGGGGGGGNGDGGGGTGDQSVNNTKAEFTLTAFDRTGLNAGQSQNGLNRLALMLGQSELTRVNGTILAVNQADGSTQEFQYALDIDANAFSIPSDVELPLDPGTYDFYFLMSGPNNKQYAGVALGWVIFSTEDNSQGSAQESQGQGTHNVITFLVHPVIGGIIPDVNVLRQLAEFHFGFNNLPIQNWGNPEFGIKVDNGPEYNYSINGSTGFNQAFVYLPQGQYTFEIRFYDGGTLVVVPIVIDVSINDDGGSINVDVVPLQIVNNVTPTQEQQTMLNLVIPGGAIDQGGGPGSVEALFTLKDSQGTLVEQVLQLDPVGDNYEASVLAPTVVPGLVTWSVQFRNTQLLSDQLYAYCAESTTLASGSQTLLCDLRLSDSVPSGYMLVEVTSNGQPVVGAVVTANGETVGVTGDGSGSLPAGQVEIFLPEATYDVTVSKPGLGNDLVQSVTVTSGQAANPIFEFIPDDQTPPVVTIDQPDGDTNNPEPLLVYSVDDPDATVKVWVDGDEVATRTGQTLDHLDDDHHEIVVEATDAVGNVGSDSIGFYVDSTAPGISITSPVNGSLINDKTPTLTFRTGESGTTDVSVDDGASGAFSVEVTGGTPYSEDLNALGDGGHRIDLIVYDHMGNSSSAFTEFTIDTEPPYVHIEGPIGDTTDRTPKLTYEADEGTQQVLVDKQPVGTRDGENLPQLSEGEHTITVNVTDLAGNVGSDAVIVNVIIPPPAQAYELNALYYRHPTRREDQYVQLDQPLRIRIPDQDAIQVIAGNAERYLLYLRLGDVHCLYLGGSYNAAIGGVELDDLQWFRRFKSPVCGLGRYHAGDVINVEGSIRARILFGDPKFDLTHLQLFLDIVGPGESNGHHWGDHDHDDDHDGDHDRGHGNDDDHHDDDNPGQGHGNGPGGVSH